MNTGKKYVKHLGYRNLTGLIFGKSVRYEGLIFLSSIGDTGEFRGSP